MIYLKGAVMSKKKLASRLGLLKWICALTLAFSLSLILGLSSTKGSVADAQPSYPTFVSGDGITVLSQVNNGREIDLEVDTTAVAGEHEVIVLLPAGYNQEGTTRYPVLYLMHGALAGPEQWVTAGGDALSITQPYPLITVIPDQGVKGWNTNWVNAGAVGPQNWETFTLDQLVPWIDSNLLTIANRSGRGIAGLSMSGWGAIHYAEDRPDLFSYAASFSGALDLGNFTTESAIVGEEIGIVPGSGTPVPLGSIFGPEYWPFNQYELQITDVNPANIANLQNTVVDLYVGTGDLTSGDGIVEYAVKPQNDLMAYNMWQAGINYWYSQDHYNSASFGYGCDNNHDIMCWNAYLNNALPRMMAVVQHPPMNPLPIVNDGNFDDSDIGPWACIGNCGVDEGIGNGYNGNPNNGWVRNNNNAWNDIDQLITVQPNTNYTLTGYIRSSSNADNGYFGVRDYSGNIVGQTEFNYLPDYTQLTVNFNSGNNSELVVFAGEWTFGDTWIQVDNVSITPSF
jgi:S-formylglutathione hydrolase FrmB